MGEKRLLVAEPWELLVQNFDTYSMRREDRRR
jgi:hypothetical protein